MWVWLVVIILEERKARKVLNREVVGEVTVKSHWQKPAVFSLALPFLSAAASKRNLRQVKGAQSELKGTELKFVCERIRESDKRIVRDGRRQNRRGLCERLLGAVCLL